MIIKFIHSCQATCSLLAVILLRLYITLFLKGFQVSCSNCLLNCFCAYQTDPGQSNEFCLWLSVAYFIFVGEIISDRNYTSYKSEVYDESVCTCTQIEEYCIRRNVHTVYIKYQETRTPSLANPSIQTMPPGTTPLQGPVTWNPDHFTDTLRL